MVKKPGTRWILLTQYYPPEIGAPQLRLHSLLRELSNYGIHTDGLTALPNYPIGKIFPGYNGRWKVEEEIDGVHVTRTWVYAATGKSAKIRLSNYLSFTATSLLTLFFSKRPDILFVESQPISLGIVAILMKWIRGVPYIYNVPDLQVDVARQLGFIKNNAFLGIAWYMENLFLSQSWKISTVTHRFIDHFIDRGFSPEQITFLPNGADTEMLKPSTPNTEMLTRWSLSGKKVIAYVGTHAYYHGLDTLIEASSLLRDNKDIAFLMIGDGPERSRLMQMAADRHLSNIVFGVSPYDEMNRLYSIVYASVAMLRNIEVAHRMRLSKVFPSLSCGVPVIYSGAGEAAELIESNKCGIIVPPEDPAKLAEAIHQLCQNPDLRNKMGTAGRLLVENEYSWRVIVRRWLSEINYFG